VAKMGVVRPERLITPLIFLDTAFFNSYTLITLSWKNVYVTRKAVEKSTAFLFYSNRGSCLGYFLALTRYENTQATREYCFISFRHTALEGIFG